MSRYLYSYLIKMILACFCLCLFAPSITYIICSMMIDREMNIVSLIISVLSFLIWCITEIIILILNFTAKNRVVFSERGITFKEKSISKYDLDIKYFKFHISIIEPDLVIPKLYIKSNEYKLYITIYFSKKDIQKIKSLNFPIKEI